MSNMHVIVNGPMNQTIIYKYCHSGKNSFDPTQARKRNYSNGLNKAICRVIEKQRETKYYSTYHFDTVINNAVLTDWRDPVTEKTFSCPTIGLLESDRLGRQIKVYTFKIRGMVMQNTRGGGADFPESTTLMGARIVVLWNLNKDLLDTTAYPDQVGECFTAGPDDEDYTIAFQNVSRLGCWKILKDITLDNNIQTLTFSDTNVYRYAATNIPFAFDIRMKTPLVINFNTSTTVSIASVIDMSLHLGIMIAPTPTAPSSNKQEFSYSARISFTE